MRWNDKGTNIIEDSYEKFRSLEYGVPHKLKQKSFTFKALFFWETVLVQYRKVIFKQNIGNEKYISEIMTQKFQSK